MELWIIMVLFRLGDFENAQKRLFSVELRTNLKLGWHDFVIKDICIECGQYCKPVDMDMKMLRVVKIVQIGIEIEIGTMTKKIFEVYRFFLILDV